MDTKISKIMNTSVIGINPETNLKAAVDILAKNNISGLPVVDEEEKVVGIITERDVVEYSDSIHVIPLISSSSWVSPHTDVSEIASFRKGFELLDNTKVEKAMNKDVVKANEDNICSEVIDLMKKHKINRVPVVNNEGKLTGIVTRTDILNHLAEDNS